MLFLILLDYVFYPNYLNHLINVSNQGVLWSLPVHSACAISKRWWQSVALSLTIPHFIAGLFVWFCCWIRNFVGISVEQVSGGEVENGWNLHQAE